ncbi:MAG: AAA family ATPase [Leptospiraceae bacterium]|nr:AAA family ATPase [Leptospiraceae bacterium]
MELSPAEARNRFHFVFTQFISIFAKEEHPLVIFLDDLQWSDLASLDLIESLMTSVSAHYLFLIGAYRDNEVTPSSPLILTLEAIRKFNTENHPEEQKIQEIFLSPLSLETVQEILFDSLHVTFEESKELAEVIEYKFVHDRVQQAAYNLLSEIERKDLHIRIGYAIYENSTEKEVEETIFEIVSHLNHLEIESLEEEQKNLLIKLNLQAAKKAKSATAYNAAYNYLSLCVRLLNQNSWEEAFELTYDIYLNLAEVSYLTLRFEECERLAELIISKCEDLLLKMPAYQVKMDSYKAQNKAPEAVRTVWEAVAMLGFKLPTKPGKLDVLISLIRLNLALRGKEPEDIEKLSAIQDPKFKAASTMLMNAASAAFSRSYCGNEPRTFPV